VIKIRLTLPPDFEVIEDVRKSAARVQQNDMPDADALLMFSCVGRLAEFGPMISDEIQGLKTYSMFRWQDSLPMANLGGHTR
jgi:hypothetical protein